MTILTTLILIVDDMRNIQKNLKLTKIINFFILRYLTLLSTTIDS